MSSTTYFVTGANRGIGFKLVSKLLETPSNRVVASVRDVSKATELASIASANKNLSIITLDLGSTDSISKLDGQLSTVSPDGIDVFISNAGVGTSYDPVLQTSREDMIQHFVVNAVGAIEVYKVVHAYLEKKETKKAFFVTSMAASNAIHVTSTGAYAESKAALNKIVGLLASELKDEGFVIGLIHPGVVETDMFTTISASETVPKEVAEGLKSALITPDKSAAEILKVVDGAGLEQSSKFLSYDGTELPW